MPDNPFANQGPAWVLLGLVLTGLCTFGGVMIALIYRAGPIFGPLMIKGIDHLTQKLFANDPDTGEKNPVVVKVEEALNAHNSLIQTQITNSNENSQSFKELRDLVTKQLEVQGPVAAQIAEGMTRTELVLTKLVEKGIDSQTAQILTLLCEMLIQVEKHIKVPSDVIESHENRLGEIRKIVLAMLPAPAIPPSLKVG